MLWAALTTAALTVIAAALLVNDITRRPEQAVYLYTTALLGTWGVLLPAKVLEGRKVNVKVRKLIYLLIGVFVGLAVWVLSGWLGIGPLPTWETGSSEVFHNVAGRSTAAVGPRLCGLLRSGVWPDRMVGDDSPRSQQAVPDHPGGQSCPGGRTARRPVAFTQPWVLTAVGMTALVAQVVHPLDAQAAAYARYAARARHVSSNASHEVATWFGGSSAHEPQRHRVGMNQQAPVFPG